MENGRTSLLPYSTNAYPRGLPLSGPDLWKRKSSLEILPNFENAWSNVYLDANVQMVSWGPRMGRGRPRVRPTLTRRRWGEDFRRRDGP